MKKFIFLITLILSIISCGLKPEQTVEKFLENVKTQNIQQAVELTSNKEFTKNLNNNFNNDIQKKFFEELYKNLEYKIINSSEQEDKTIIVNVEITNIDVQDLLIQVFQKSVQKAFLGAKGVNIEEEIISLLNSQDLNKKKVLDQYVVEKVGKKYKVKLNSTNVDNIFGGYYTSILGISNIGK